MDPFIALLKAISIDVLRVLQQVIMPSAKCIRRSHLFIIKWFAKKKEVETKNIRDFIVHT